MYTVIDTDTGERFITRDYESLFMCTREKERLQRLHGDDFCFAVAEIDNDGNLHEVETN